VLASRYHLVGVRVRVGIRVRVGDRINLTLTAWTVEQIDGAGFCANSYIHHPSPYCVS
jgi:hypothetical protein